jgi:hypothetical protein
MSALPTSIKASLPKGVLNLVKDREVKLGHSLQSCLEIIRIGLMQKLALPAENAVHHEVNIQSTATHPD